MFSKMKVFALTALLCAAGMLRGADGSSIDITKLGDLPGNTMILMNGLDTILALGQAVGNVDKKVEAKQDKLILDHSLEFAKVYKITLATEGLAVQPKYPVLYANSLNLTEAAFYNSDFDHLTADFSWSDTNAKVDLYNNIDTNDVQVSALDVDGTLAIYDVQSVEVIDKQMLKVGQNEVTTYQYSNPYDWRLIWESLDEPLVGEEIVTSSRTNLSGTIYTTFTTSVKKNSQTKLKIQYFDEVNMPNFNIVRYEVLSGPATLDNDILTSTEDGIVTVRAYASNGETRDSQVPMYKWLSGTSYTSYDDDVAGTKRKALNDWHLSLLETYRSNPTTNRHYTTWNSPSASHHYSNPGDYFTADYGRQFSPYQHMGVNSGGDNGFWWSHAAVSKHVLLAAAHYGDYNFNRFLNGTEYFNFNGEFTGKTSVIVRKWYVLSKWAAEHGFEGSDAECGDIAFWVVDGDIPNECLPYLATADWINARYGVNSDGQSYVPGITLQQGMMVGLKAMTLGSTCCSGVSAGPSLGRVFETDPIKSTIMRSDLYTYWAKGGWHDGILGDSGHPSFIFDPELTTGLTSSQGITLYRPILTTVCTWASGGGTGLPRFMKVIKAFCAWVAEQKGITLEQEMPYVLGDPDTQSTDTDVIKNNAIRASGGTVNAE